MQRPRGGVEVQLYSFFDLGARRGCAVMTCAGWFTSRIETWYKLYSRMGEPQGWPEKSLPHQASIPRLSSRQQGIILTTLRVPSIKCVFNFSPVFVEFLTYFNKTLMSYIWVVVRTLSTNTCRSSWNVSVTPVWFQSVQLVLKLLHTYIHTYVHTYMRTYIHSGPGSVVGIATGYRLDGPEIEPWWAQDFPHLSRSALGPTQPPIQWIPGLSRG
jgi:hypothetical protein